MQGVVMPLILRRTKPGAESYQVIDGHFEYYAALRAKEIDPRLGGTINAYIVESEQEVPFYQQQIQMFRQRTSTLPSTISATTKSVEVGIEKNSSNKRLIAIEKTLNQLVTKNEVLETTVGELKKQQLPDAINRVISDQFNQIRQEIGVQLNALSEQLSRSVSTPIVATPTPSKKTSSEQKQKWINEVNTLSI
jgi:tRNA U34 5-carboxymethylaminomethyl modifying enzyme MnmG/GidA